MFGPLKPKLEKEKESKLDVLLISHSPLLTLSVK